MSSAENGRLVYLDDDLCGLIYTALAHSYPKDIAKADTFWRAWKGAPADPAEALRIALVARCVGEVPDIDGLLWALAPVPQRPTPRDETPHG